MKQISMTVSVLSRAIALLACVACAEGDGDAALSDGADESMPDMHLVAFDAEVARAHGYDVVTLPDGSAASVPADQARAARDGDFVPMTGVLPPEHDGAEPGLTEKGYAEVPGECGVSNVALSAEGFSQATLQSGFRLDPDAGNVWDVNWNVTIADDGGVSSQHFEEGNGMNAGGSWLSDRRLLSLTRGTAFATVQWYSSYVITTHGWFCYSYGPTAVETIW